MGIRPPVDDTPAPVSNPVNLDDTVSNMTPAVQNSTVAYADENLEKNKAIQEKEELVQAAYEEQIQEGNENMVTNNTSKDALGASTIPNGAEELYSPSSVYGNETRTVNQRIDKAEVNNAEVASKTQLNKIKITRKRVHYNNKVKATIVAAHRG